MEQLIDFHAPEVQAVLDPIKLVIDNYPEGEVEYLEADNNLEIYHEMSDRKSVV